MRSKVALVAGAQNLHSNIQICTDFHKALSCGKCTCIGHESQGYCQDATCMIGKLVMVHNPKLGQRCITILYSALHMEERHGCHVAVSHHLESHPFVAMHLCPCEWVGPQTSSMDGSNACVSQDRLDVFEVTVCCDVNPWRI